MGVVLLRDGMARQIPCACQEVRKPRRKDFADCRPDARKLKVRFQKKADGAEMRICGGPRDGITVTVRIPATTDLSARVPFGEVVVENLQGNQDVRLHAGELTVALADREAYSRVDASVVTGEVDASAFGESKGGLFRRFHRAGQGSYRLHARVGAGQITLR